MENILANPNDQSTNLVAHEREEFLSEYLTLMGVYDNGFKGIVEELSKTDYFHGPSSTKWHAAYPGGGFDHAFHVTKCLVKMTQEMGLKWQRPISPFLVGLLHDYTKVGAYVMKQEMNPVTHEVETWYEWNPEARKLSDIHGEDSLLKVREIIQLTEEEEACIRWHMGAYEGKESWPGYDAAIRKFPNVLWTHTADMYASKVMEERNAD